jgi:hypothetical protein
MLPCCHVALVTLVAHVADITLVTLNLFVSFKKNTFENMFSYVGIV